MSLIITIVSKVISGVTPFSELKHDYGVDDNYLPTEPIKYIPPSQDKKNMAMDFKRVSTYISNAFNSYKKEKQVCQN
jgi:hypothetical protein